MEPKTQHKTYIYAGTVKILSSELTSIQTGTYYPVFQSGARKFLYDNTGAKTYLVKKKIKWEETDSVVMIVKITSSVLESVKPEKIYRVFNDFVNDERYILDEQNRKVLFDRTIFNYEII